LLDRLTDFASFSWRSLRGRVQRSAKRCMP
jgi:hypothetical protein